MTKQLKNILYLSIMKYIITNQQRKKLLTAIQNYLNNKFSDDIFICEVNIIPIDSEEDTNLFFEMILIFRQIKEELIVMFEKSILEETKFFIKKDLKNLFNIDENQYRVSYNTTYC